MVCVCIRPSERSGVNRRMERKSHGGDVVRAGEQEEKVGSYKVAWLGGERQAAQKGENLKPWQHNPLPLGPSCRVFWPSCVMPVTLIVTLDDEGRPLLYEDMASTMSKRLAIWTALFIWRIVIACCLI